MKAALPWLLLGMVLSMLVSNQYQFSHLEIKVAELQAMVDTMPSN